jgi:Uma2 family endonuclease
MATAELRDIEETETVPDEPKGLYEVVDGKVVEKATGILEIDIANDIQDALRSYARPKGLGRAWCEMMFLTIPSTGQTRRPDVAFLSAERWPMNRRLPEGSALEVLPELAVEVVSPSDGAGDLQAKILEYFAAGVRQVWVVHRTSVTIVVHESASASRTLARGDVLDGGTILPGFRLAVSDLLADPSPAAERAGGGEPTST